MAYIQSHQSLGHHRKTLRMVDMLRVNRVKLIGHLHELFWWGLDNADSQGVLGRIAAVDIADAACWPTKDAERFVRALLECGGANHPGFLEQRSEVGYVLHDWYDYAGKFSDKRELRKESNRRAQAARRERLLEPPSANSQHAHADSALTFADIADSQHPSVAKRSVAKRSVAYTPLVPPLDVSADALNTNGDASETPPACCPNFAKTGEHWEFCPSKATAEHA
jgi:hypothetical protein